jgi:hypothetical protein
MICEAKKVKVGDISGCNVDDKKWHEEANPYYVWGKPIMEAFAGCVRLSD